MGKQTLEEPYPFLGFCTFKSLSPSPTLGPVDLSPTTDTPTRNKSNLPSRSTTKPSDLPTITVNDIMMYISKVNVKIINKEPDNYIPKLQIFMKDEYKQKLKNVSIVLAWSTTNPKNGKSLTGEKTGKTKGRKAKASISLPKLK